jgi:predicted Zn-dependent peptidase
MFDGPLTTADTFKSAMEFGLGFDYFEQMKNTILNITAKELQQLANTYFHFDKMVTVVAGILE